MKGRVTEKIVTGKNKICAWIFDSVRLLQIDYKFELPITVKDEKEKINL